MASRSTDDGDDARASAKNAACRSRGITWVETGSGFRPSFFATCSSTRGSMLAKVPTAPEIAQVAISSRAVDQPRAGAGEFGISPREFQAEGGRLGMDAVRAADGRRQLVLEGAALQRREQRVDVGDQEVARPLQLHGEAGVEHVGARSCPDGRSAHRADELGEMGQKGDDVVLGDALDLVDARDVELRVAALLPDRLARPAFGMTPISASASQAWASISNQMRKRVSGAQIAVISGRE